MDPLDELQGKLERAERAAAIALDDRRELVELLDDVLNGPGCETAAERLDAIRAAVMAHIPNTTGFKLIAEHIESLTEYLAELAARRPRRIEPRGATGVTNCILCGKELHEKNGAWYTWDAGDSPHPVIQDYVWS